MNNYPPGVSGNEYEIAGPDYQRDHPEPCPKCGGHMLAEGYKRDHWIICVDCNSTFDLWEE
jgi:ribosomal protein S27AE